jgi:DNA-binding XRE family transcriptional regulator
MYKIGLFLRGVLDNGGYSHREYCTTMRNKVKRHHIDSRPDLRAIGRRIREIRGFDLTQAELGRILGVGQTQLSKYEMGHSVPTLELLLRLKAYSGRSIDWIVTGEGSPTGEK